MKRFKPVSRARRILAAIAIAGSPLILSTTPLPPGNMPYGAFDPEGDYSDEPDAVIEHVFLPWEDVSLISLLDADEYALERGRALMVTIEPGAAVIPAARGVYGVRAEVERGRVVAFERRTPTDHLLAPGGAVLAMKGAYPKAELVALEAAGRSVRVFPLSVPELGAGRHLLLVEAP